MTAPRKEPITSRNVDARVGGQKPAGRFLQMNFAAMEGGGTGMEKAMGIALALFLVFLLLYLAVRLVEWAFGVPSRLRPFIMGTNAFHDGYLLNCPNSK